MNKNVLFFAFLVLLVFIPVSFAGDDVGVLTSEVNASATGDVLSVSEDNVLETDYIDIYVNSSISDEDDANADGSSENPYKYISMDVFDEIAYYYPDCVVNVYLASGDYEIQPSSYVDMYIQYFGYYSMEFNNVNFIGEDCQDTKLTSQFDVNIYGESSIHDLTIITPLMFSYGNFVIENSIFKDNIVRIVDGIDEYATLEGAIYATGSNLNIRNSTFENNSANCGGAVNVNGGILVIDNCTFLNNSAVNHGGAVLCENGNVTITNSRFGDNYALGDVGGAVCVIGSNLTFSDSNVTGCVASFGSAVTSLSSNVSISRSRFEKNSAFWYGGAIYSMFGVMEIMDSGFVENSAVCGGALFVDSMSLCHVESLFRDNSAYCGGAIYSFRSNNQFNNVYETDYDSVFETVEFNLTFYDSGDYLVYVYRPTDVTELPSSYNLADFGFVTSVKNQLVGGNCWSFAALAALESCILKAGGDCFDFSEENMKNVPVFYSDYGLNIFEPNGGGNQYLALSYLTSWLGPVMDEDDLYGDHSILSPVLQSLYHVQNVITLSDDADELKWALLNYGAVATTMYYDDENYYNPVTFGYYYNKAFDWDYGDFGHAVTIVGWDDTYSKSNFLIEPSRDGAWIIKNSWGADWGDDGYFYVSYDDTYFAQMSTYTFLLNDSVKYDKNYQYDLGDWMDYNSGAADEVTYTNIFTVGGDEYLAAVSTYFLDTCDYIVEVSVNDVLKVTKEGHMDKTGYFTIPLGKYLYLNSGDVLSVSFTIKNTESGMIYVPTSPMSYYNNNVMKAGISYVKSGDNLIDLFEEEQCVASIRAFTIVDPIKTFINLTVEDSRIIASVTDQYGNILNEGNVTFNVNGECVNVSVSDFRAVFDYDFGVYDLYNITVSWSFEAYESCTNNTVFETSWDVTSNVEDISYGGCPVVNVSLGDGKSFNNNVTIRIGDYSYSANITHDSCLFSVPDILKADDVWNVSLEYVTVNGYHKFANTTFKISKVSPDLDVIIDDVVYGESVRVESNIDGDYSYSFDLNDGDFASQSGLGFIDVIADVDEYSVLITFKGNENYTEKSVSRSFKVSPAGSSVVVPDIGDITYGDLCVVTISEYENASSVVAVLYRDGVPVSGVSCEGFNITVNGSLDVGTYTLNVTAKAVDSNHNDSIPVEKEFSIIRAGSSIVIDDIGAVTYPGDVVVAYTTNSTVTGAVVYVKGTTTQKGTVAREDGKVIVSGLDAGTYVINVTVGDVNHNDGSAVKEFVVGRATASATFDGAVVVYGTGTITMNGAVVKPDSCGGVEYNGNVNVTVGFNNYTGAVVDGKLSVDVDMSVFAAGSYNITIGGSNENYTVNKLELTNNVTVNPAGSDLTLSQTSAAVQYQGNNVVVTVGGFVNTTGSNFTAAISGYNVVSVSGNSIAVNVKALNAGTYSLMVSSVVDANHTAVTKSATITVNKAPSTISPINPISLVYGESTNVSVVAGGASGITADLYNGSTPITGRVSVSGYKITVDASDLDVGTYTLRVTTVADRNHYAVSKTVIVFVIKANSTISHIGPISLVYGESGSVGVVVDGAVGVVGELCSGENVISNTVTVEGNVITIAGVDAGTYTLNVTTVPDKNHVAVSTVTNVAVAKAGSGIDAISPITMVYGESCSVSVVAVNATGINAVLYRGVVSLASPVNVDGVVVGGVIIDGNKITIKEGIDAGDYTLVVVTCVDDNHESFAVTAGVTVVKANINVTIKAEDVIYPGDVVVAVCVDVGGEYNLTVGESTQLISLEVGSAREFIYSGLGAGSYDVSLCCDVSANYNAVSKSVNVTVAKAGSGIDAISPITMVYGESGSVSVVAVNATGINAVLYRGVVSLASPVNVDGVVVGGVIIDGNKITIKEGIDAGDYTLVVVTCVDDNHESFAVTAGVTVVKANINVTIKAEDVIYPGDVVVAVCVDVGGEYNLTVGESTQLISLEVGSAREFIYSGLGAGSYDVSLCCDVSANYNAVSKSVNVTVDKAPVTLNVSVFDVIYPGDVIVSVTADVAGNYTVTLGATAQNITLEAGSAKELTYSGLAAGNYNVTVGCGESSNYSAVSVSANVTVSKAHISVNVTVVDVVYPCDVVVVVSVDVGGEYNLTVGAVSEVISLEAGSAKEFTFSGLGADTYNICVACGESENYTAVSAVANVTVAKAPVSVSISAGDVTYPGDVVVCVSASVVGTYTLTVGATSQIIGLDAGVVNEFNYSGLGAGTYNISVSGEETSNYAAVFESVSVVVNKVENTTISIESTSPLAGENATVTVSLPADATGTVSVTYEGNTYSDFVVNGTARVSVSTSVAGIGIAGVFYSGDDNYASVSGDVNVTVKERGVVIAGDIRRGVNSPYDYLATLVDGDANPVGGVEITFTINGQIYKATTNGSGVATVSAGLTVSNYAETVYNVVVTNPFTGENSTATTTIVPRLVVLSGDLSAGYLENPAFVVQAFGDDGLVVGAGEIVRFTLNGKTYDIATNASGIAVRTIALVPGQYGVYAVYEGYKTVQSVFKVYKTLSVSSGTVKKTASSFTFKAVLKSSVGVSVAGKTVTFKFNGKKYAVRTNVNGVAQYTIKSGVIKKLKKGTYQVFAMYVNEVAKANIRVK